MPVKVFILAAALAAACSVPSFAADLYPIDIQMEPGEIRKVYELNAEGKAAEIPKEDFQIGGYLYTFLDMTRQDLTQTDTKEVTKRISADSKSKEMAAVLKLLPAEYEVSEDGYMGSLSLDHTTVSVEAKGYKVNSKQLSATRTFPNLSAADPALIPKTAEENGHVLTLASINWKGGQAQEMDGYALPSRFTAVAVYKGDAVSRTATGYTVSASYRGNVSKTVQSAIRYTTVFTGTPIEPEEKPLLSGWMIFCAALVLLFVILIACIVWRRRKNEKVYIPVYCLRVGGVWHSPGPRP